MLEIGEILCEGALLPVTIRGEVPGRAMRGGADIDNCRRYTAAYPVFATTAALSSMPNRSRGSSGSASMSSSW
ncbi:MAG: hypothetical protein EOS21_25090 [Mesorhizobium sp.]|nr:MAG: hypothetical protein EOS21_25090 [Mesorhizobium sp.]